MGASQEKSKVAAGGAKRRRWPRIIGVIVIALAALVIVLPYLISTGPGTRVVLAIVNGQIKQKIHVDDLSLRWFGPMVIRGLRVNGPAGDEIAAAPTINWSGGVWKAIFSPYHFGTIDVDSPVITADLGKPSQPEQPSNGPLPDIIGDVRVKDGLVKIINPQGRLMRIEHVDGQVALRTLNDIKGAITGVLAQSPLKGDLAVRDLGASGKIDVLTAKGGYTIRSAGLFLPDLSEFALKEGQLGGKGDIDVKGDFASNHFNTTYKLSLAQLTAGQAGRQALKPIDIALNGEVDYTPGKLRGKTELSGTPGTIKLDLLYDPSKPWPDLTAGELLSAIMAKGVLVLPEFTVTADGKLDLPTLASAVPALLAVRKDTTVTGGTFIIDKLSASGGANPSTAGTVGLTGVTATSAGKEISLEPMTLAFDATLRSGKGLQIKQATVKSQFAQLQAVGNADNLNANFNADLAAMQQQLGQVFDMGGLKLAGKLDGTAKVVPAKEASADRTGVELAVSLNNFSYSSDGSTQPLEIKQAKLTQSGYLLTSANKFTKAVTDSISLEADDVAIKGKGWYDLSNGALGGDMQLDKTQIARIAQWAGALGLEGLKEYTGEVTLVANASRAGKDQPLVTSGTGEMTELAVNGKMVGAGVAKAQWKDLKLSQASGEIEMASAKLTGPADVDISNVHGGVGRLTWHAVIKGDIATAMTAAAPFMGQQKPPAITGTLNYTADVTQEGSVATLRSGGQIDNLQFQSGDKPITTRESKITLNGKMDVGTRLATLEQLQIDSNILSLQAKGTIDKPNADQVLDITGSYKTSWDKLIPLLRELFPQAMEKVAISGDSGSDFRMVGPIAQKGVTPSWRGLKVTGFTLHWTGAEVYGIKTAAASLSPTISDGKFDLPMTDLAANNGTLKIGGNVDLTGKDPIYDLASKVQIMQKIEITPELKEAFLTRLNPIFTHVAGISGSVTLQSTGLNLPLSEAIKRQGSGQGHLDLTDLKIGPSGDFAKIFEFMGVGDPSSMRLVKVNGVDFQIHDGKISYQNFAMDMGVFDLVFSGTIGFDDSMQMTVTVPLNGHFLKMLGVQGPIADALNGVRVSIPLVGTRKDFHIAFDKIDMKPLIENATKNMLLKPGPGLPGLQGLPNPLGTKQPPKDQPSSQPSDQPPPKKQPKNSLDNLKGILK